MAKCESNPGITGDPKIEHRVGALATRLINLKAAAPGSEHHTDALRQLMDVLATEPGAIDVLARQQGVQKKDGI